MTGAPSPRAGAPPRTLRVVGIGAGDPEHLTLQAVGALRDVAVVFALDKGAETAELLALRAAICARHIARPYRFVTLADPPRERRPADYGAAVAAWHDARADLLGRAIADELGAGEAGAILVWGDPALYDSTLRVLDRVLARDADAFALEVIPGITSVQALAAAHRVPLHGVGAPLRITPGRRLGAGPEGDESAVVMLDADPTFAGLDPTLTIYWGAYLGTPHEITRAGILGTVGPEIRALREQARARHGWIMDVYLLRRIG